MRVTYVRLPYYIVDVYIGTNFWLCIVYTCVCIHILYHIYMNVPIHDVLAGGGGRIEEKEYTYLRISENVARCIHVYAHTIRLCAHIGHEKRVPRP